MAILAANKSGIEFKNLLSHYEDESGLPERYIAPFLNYMVGQGYNLELSDAKKPKIFGTPNDLCNTFNIRMLDLISENSSISGFQRETLVVDIDENGLVELVRNIRSSLGYIDGDFQTFSIDIGSIEFTNLVNNNNGYDIWMNFAALKHVRSEKDPYTLMRLIEVNILNTFKTMQLAIDTGA